VIVAHIMGLPIEESVLQLAPAGAAMMTAIAIAGRTGLSRLRRRSRHLPRGRVGGSGADSGAERARQRRDRRVDVVIGDVEVGDGP
jgi:hypothetical protein